MNIERQSINVKFVLKCLGKDLVIIAGDIEKVFTEDDIRKRAEDEQKVLETTKIY